MQNHFTDYYSFTFIYYLLPIYALSGFITISPNLSLCNQSIFCSLVNKVFPDLKSTEKLSSSFIYLSMKSHYPTLAKSLDAKAKSAPKGVVCITTIPTHITGVPICSITCSVLTNLCFPYTLNIIHSKRDF